MAKRIVIEEQFRQVLPHYDAQRVLSNTFAASEMQPIKEDMDAFVKDILIVFEGKEDKGEIQEAYDEYCKSFFKLHDVINETYKKNIRRR